MTEIENKLDENFSWLTIKQDGNTPGNFSDFNLWITSSQIQWL